jgi:hypothetical protein
VTERLNEISKEIMALFSNYLVRDCANGVTRTCILCVVKFENIMKMLK